MIQITSFVSIKGGVGKSTLIYEALCNLIQDKKVLVIDMDYQATITRSLGQLTDTDTIGDCLLQKSKLQPVEIIPDKLDLIPGSLLAENIETQAINQEISLERLKEAIHQLLDDSETSYDHILIDTPSSFLYLTSVAALACNQIIIPSTLNTTALADIKLVKNKLNFLYMRTMIPIEQFPKFKIIENLYKDDSAYDQRLDAQLKKELGDETPLLQVQRTHYFRQVFQNYKLAQEHLLNVKSKAEKECLCQASLAKFIEA